MKMAIVFIGIVFAAFFVMYMITRTNVPKQPSAGDFLTPTPDIGIKLNGFQGQSGQTQDPNQVKGESTQKIQPISAKKAVIKTAKGDIELDLYPEDAPKTVTNFATLAKYGYYNNLTFHRVEPGFVIQGGDPNGNGTGGVSIYGEKFEDELNSSTKSYQEGYKEGVLAMANSGPNTNGSQFFIMLADTPLPNDYTIFGKVTSGMDVVKQIEVGDKMTTIEVE